MTSTEQVHFGCRLRVLVIPEFGFTTSFRHWVACKPRQPKSPTQNVRDSVLVRYEWLRVELVPGYGEDLVRALEDEDVSYLIRAM